MSRRVSVLVLFLVLASSAFPQTVVQRARLGHIVEDLDTFEKRLVAIDGRDVYVADSKGAFEKLFSLPDHCTGIVYVPTEKTYLLVAPAQLNAFYVFDEKGAALGTRPITYLPGFTPVHIEAATYLDKTSPYPDHIAFLAYSTFAQAHVTVAKRDGTVVYQFALPPLFLDSTFGLSAAGGNHLYVFGGSNDIYTIDFSGNVVSGPVKVHDGFGFEGITVAGDRVYVRDYFSGKFAAFDTNLQRTPADDLRHDFGLGLGQFLGLTWNSDEHRYITLNQNRDYPLGPVAWDMVSPLDEARPRFYPLAHGYQRARGLSWMPDEQKIATCHPQPQRRILIYSPLGELLEQIDVTPIGRPNHIAWIPSAQEFYVRTFEFPTRIRVLSRAGSFLRDIELGTNVGPFTRDGNQLLIFMSGLLHRTDLAGNILASYDYSSLNVIPAAITSITSGPQAGMYAVASATGTEVVVFSLP